MGLKTREEKDLDNKLAIMLVQLNKIYSNKSSDEYKMAGDITKSKMYDGIENMTAYLSQLKGYSKSDASSMKQMFNALHRPIYKKLVKEYLNKPDDRNCVFTTIFTCGYRVLVGELSRIFASTVATEKGLIYKPEKIAQSITASRFIKAFNNNMEQKMDEYIRKSHKSMPLPVQTEYYIYQEDVASAVTTIGTLSVLGTAIHRLSEFLNQHEIIPWMNAISDIGDFIFGARSEINPISYMNYILTSQYDKKVAAFYNAEKMYEETKAAYEEYMKLPDSDRKAKVESKYVKNMKKYNMKMENLRAQIAHYDSRAMAEAKENVRRVTKQKPKPEPKPSNDDNTEVTTSDNTNTEPGDDVNTPTNSSDDLDW